MTQIQQIYYSQNLQEFAKIYQEKLQSMIRKEKLWKKKQDIRHHHNSGFLFEWKEYQHQILSVVTVVVQQLHSIRV